MFAIGIDERHYLLIIQGHSQIPRHRFRKNSTMASTRRHRAPQPPAQGNRTSGRQKPTKPPPSSQKADSASSPASVSIIAESSHKHRLQPHEEHRRLQKTGRRLSAHLARRTPALSLPSSKSVQMPSRSRSSISKKYVQNHALRSSHRRLYMGEGILVVASRKSTMIAPSSSHNCSNPASSIDFHRMALSA